MGFGIGVGVPNNLSQGSIKNVEKYSTMPDVTQLQFGDIERLRVLRKLFNN